jgi:multiple sugar transport system substrate-binding protein
VRLVDDKGELLVDDPKVRAGLINALRDYTDIRKRDCTPPSSTGWKDPDNNASFHDRSVLLTYNTTIAIAAKWREDTMDEALSAERRAQAKRNYDEMIVTTGFPNKPDGSRMVYRAAVKTGVVFEGAKNKRRAKEFVLFLLDDANLQPYVESALGRWFPVTKSGAQSSFWQEDPHRKAVFGQFRAGTVPFEFTRNHRFTTLNNENVWAKAMGRVLNDNVSVERAVDELIARIKQVAG